MKIRLDETFFEDVVEIPAVESEIDIDAVSASAPRTGPENGIANLLISAINDEWNTISFYNDLIVNANDQHMPEIAKVVTDIVAEENIHVGQLQAALETISPNASKITQGELEGHSQLGESFKLEHDLGKDALSVADYLEQFLESLDLPSTVDVDGYITFTERIELARAITILQDFGRLYSTRNNHEV